MGRKRGKGKAQTQEQGPSGDTSQQAESSPSADPPQQTQPGPSAPSIPVQQLESLSLAEGTQSGPGPQKQKQKGKKKQQQQAAPPPQQAAPPPQQPPPGFGQQGAPGFQQPPGFPGHPQQYGGPPQGPWARGAPGQPPMGGQQYPQQLQGPPGQPQQWQGPPGQPPQWQGRPGQPQQWQGPPGQPQQWQGPPGQHQQWQGPPGQPQQRQGPPGQFQQQQGHPGQPQQWQGPPGPSQQQQGHPGQPQQWQGPPGPSQQHQGPRGQPQQRQGPPGQPQQRQAPPGQPQQRQGPQGQPQQRQQGPQQSQQQPQQRQQQQGRQGPQQQRQQRQQPQLDTPPPPAEGAFSPSQPQAGPSSSPPLVGQGDCLKQVEVVTPGTKGRKIIVESNHLSLNLGNLMEAIHYDVAITPDTPKSLLRDVMERFRQKHYPQRYPAFDGRKNLYSPIKLPFGPSDSLGDTIKVEGENRPKEFKVEVKFARTVDLSPLHDMLKTRQSPQDALQCLDIVLRNAPSNNCIIAGRCFFTPPRDQIVPLGDGMEMYYGFYQSAIRGWKPLLNVDVAHKAFPSALDFLDLICELGSDYRTTMDRSHLARPIHDSLKNEVEKFVKQLKVKYEIPGQSGSKRIYRVNGLGDPAAKVQFKLEDGRTTTVEKYYQETKRYKLHYPHLPTLWVGARDRPQKILLPIEFCKIVEGQAVNRKMNENQTSAMIKKSATSTDVRKQKIMRSLESVRYNDDPTIRQFGFSVNNKFEKLEARVLPPPELKYAKNAKVTVSRGVWKLDRSQFLAGAEIKKWTIVSVTRFPPKDIQRLADDVFRMAPSTGMRLASQADRPFAHVGSGRLALQDYIQFFRSKREYDLIFVVVPGNGPNYSLVKQAAELNVGCLTQCIKDRTLARLNPQTVANILLKVNSKMNGTNHVLYIRPPIMNRPCMIMGADVTHPSPDAKDIPSVAAVTASHDPQAFKYNICWRLQPPKVEIIEDLCNITIEQLKFFFKQTGCKPERIVFFRDGVSEGQFREVQRAEISAIQRACKTLQKENYEPKITFLVVQKRHHTRLFPTNPRDSEDKNNNVPAGTCVDKIITNPRMQDFYLVSHASIQGVAKPTKYCTLWDDNDMNHDDIEELTYHLCHMFTRCNRSVSYPAPTYYAHLAAARAKVYIENDRLNMDDLVNVQERYKIQESIVKDKPMFFV